MKKSLLIIVLILFFSTNAFAAWTGAKTILELETTPNATEVRLDEAGDTTCGCHHWQEGGINKIFAKITLNNPNKEQLMSLLLVAFASGKKVNIFCTPGEEWPELRYIKVLNN